MQDWVDSHIDRSNVGPYRWFLEITIMEVLMNSSTVSIAEGKKSFSRLINDTIEKKEKIIVTRRGKPVAVIVSYQEYEQSARVDGYRQIMEAREVFLKAGIEADDVYRESRNQLDKKS
jgi:prevent-host-death family protein